ncbi:MAG: glycosyltransferase family 39 protein [candidate division Zixibacteria bacterium]|nr:glycosyltransferase family 39 protein [candidate division Zixibacteria bacterium]
MSPIERVRFWASEHPLGFILTLGFSLRVLAAFFARGYMGTDDHFQVVEIAADWQRGSFVFLPGDTQFYRSLFYPALNWLLMAFLHQLGIYHPDAVMLVTRLLHALFSLWTIVLTCKLGLLLFDRRIAFTAGFLSAAYFLMPYVAVRNLIESFCIPFLLWGLYETVKAEMGKSENPHRSWVWAGLAFGLAFLIRWQTAAAILGVGLYLTYRRQWRGLGWLSAFGLIPVLAEAVWDWWAHGVFFGSFRVYIQHNLAHSRDYIVGPWYRYLLLLIGLFIPPFSLLFLTAIVRWAKRFGILTLVALAFFIIHSAVPGKQERFLLPIFPLLALMGTAGLSFWQESRPSLRPWIRWGWRWFWGLNAVLLVLAIFNYSQKARIASFGYLYERRDAQGVVVDFTERGTLLPLYYLDGADPSHPRPEVYRAYTPADFDTLRLRHLGKNGPPVVPPNYVIIFSQGRLEEHLKVINGHLGRAEVLTHITPSLADRILLWLNPKYNHSKEAWVCRLEMSK